MNVFAKLASLCCVFYLIWGLVSCQTKYLDISEHSLVSHIAKNTYRLKASLFLVYYTDANKYTLEVPGQGSSMALTVEDYLKDPAIWQKSIDQTIGVVPKGTKIYVYKIAHKIATTYSSTNFWAKIIDPPYTNLDVDIRFLINQNLMETSFSIDERYLEYCNESE